MVFFGHLFLLILIFHGFVYAALMQDNAKENREPCDSYSTTRHYPNSRINPIENEEPTIISLNHDDINWPSLFEKESLYCPFKCKGYFRKWNFFRGTPFEEDTQVIAWISRIGYADDVIRNLGFPLQAASYTLFSYAHLTKSELYKIVPRCKFIKIECDGENLFNNLFKISSKVDTFLIKLIVAIHIVFDSYGMANIFIYMRPKHEKIVYHELCSIHSGII